MEYVQSLAGIVTIISMAWFIGGRKPIDRKLVLGGLGLQLLFVILFLKMPVANDALAALNQLVILLDKATTAGTSFVFGYLGGGELPFEATNPANVFILAFKALPLVIDMVEGQKAAHRAGVIHQVDASGDPGTGRFVGE